MASMNVELLLAIGARIAPGLAALDAPARARVVSIVEHAVASRSPKLQRQLALFLNVVRWAPLLRYGVPFHRLDPARQDAVLHWFHDAPLEALRRGFWGVKTLVFMGYYARLEAGAEIGYRPSRTGNALLHAR
jgi:hypothetical protein